MSTFQNIFEEFRDLVLANESFQEQLRAFDDQKDFISHVVALAEANGFRLSASDVEDELRRSRRSWQQAEV